MPAEDNEDHPPALCLEQADCLKELAAALPGLDSTDGEEHRAVLRTYGVAELRTHVIADRREPVRANSVMDDLRRNAVISLEGFLPGTAHHKYVIGFEDRFALAIDECLGREVVDVVDCPDDRRPEPCIANARGGTRGYAVLGMEEVEVSCRLREPSRHGVDRCEDLLVECCRSLYCREEGEGNGGGPIEGIAGPTECEQMDVDPSRLQCLGEFEGVNNAATGLRRVCEDAEPTLKRHRERLRFDWSLEAMAPATSAARAFVSVTRQPASTKVATCAA